MRYLPRIRPVCGFPIAIVNQVTLVVDDFNHLLSDKRDDKLKGDKKKKKKISNLYLREYGQYTARMSPVPVSMVLRRVSPIFKARI